MAEGTNLTENLKKLEAIAQWFDEQDDIDVEQGLTKVKEAAGLIKSSKARLAAIENEFQTIERDISGDETDDPEDGGESPHPPLVPQPRVDDHANDDAPVNLDEIPF